MQQDQRITVALLYVVKSNTAHFQELTRGRIVTLGVLRHDAVHERGDHQRCSNNRSTHGDLVRRALS